MGALTLKLSDAVDKNVFTFNGVINNIAFKSIIANRKRVDNLNAIRIANDMINAGNASKIIKDKKVKQYGCMPKQALVSAVIAIDSKVFPDLSRLAKSVLSQLSLMLDVDNPQKPVRMLRETLAESTNFKVASIYRALAELEKHELITRMEQNRKRSGRMGAGILKFTIKAIKILMPNWSVSKAVKPSQPNTRLSKNIDGKALPDTQSFLKNQSEVVDKVKYVDVGSGRRMHPELLFLLKKLNPMQIFKLCGQATKKGKKLTDIVSVKAQEIAALHGRELFSYLTHITMLERDFKSDAALIKQQAEEQIAIIDSKRAFAEWSHKIIGKKYKSNNSGKSYKVIGSKEIPFFETYINGMLQGSAPLDLKFINNVKDGVLVEV